MAIKLPSREQLYKSLYHGVNKLTTWTQDVNGTCIKIYI